MTPLPPSPEIKPLCSQKSDLEHVPFSLGGLQHQRNQQPTSSGTTSSRLRSVANYQTFAPQALACSDPIPATFSSSNFGCINGDTRQQHNGSAEHYGRFNPQRQLGQASSLGAVAGAQGVVVFRISKPHEPLIVLNHATSNRHHSTGGRPVTALAFQPDVTSSLFLAAARGSGVLLWDVSGHSLSPLLGRLAMDFNTTAPESECVTTSLCWKLSQERDGLPMLATTTARYAAVWDLRSPVAGAKPSIRFGGPSSPSRKSAYVHTSPFRQIACSRSHECAILDAAGVVRVFDVRMTDQKRFDTAPLTAFAAHQAGVGISYLPMTSTGSNSTTTAWMTWGLDSPDADATVKIWSSYTSNAISPTIDQRKSNGTSEDYWYMDGSLGRSPGSVAPYRKIAQCSPPYHLACPRVCPAPIENGVLTIGVLEDTKMGMGGGGGEHRGENWRAELWKVRPPTVHELEANDGTFGLEKIITFDGGVDRDRRVVSVLGRESRIGQLKAAELAITAFNTTGLQASKSDDGPMVDSRSTGENISLALCCLSDNGFVTTHVSFCISCAYPVKVMPLTFKDFCR
jgi:hypothetical protein